MNYEEPANGIEEQRRGPAGRCCVGLSCAAALLLVVGGVVGATLVGRAFLQTPAAVVANVAASAPGAAIPAGYDGVPGGLDVPGGVLRLSLVAPEGTTLESPADYAAAGYPLVWCVAAVQAAEAKARDVEDLAAQYIDGRIGYMASESSETIALPLDGGGSIQATELLGAQDGVATRQLRVHLPPAGLRRVCIVFRGKQEGFDEAAVRAFLSSVAPASPPVDEAPPNETAPNEAPSDEAAPADPAPAGGAPAAEQTEDAQ